MASVSWAVTFSASVTGGSSSNFTLVNSGLGGTPSITSVTGSGATRTVTASTGTGSGTLGLNMTSTTGITPALTNLPFSGQIYTIDRLAPTAPTVNSQVTNDTTPIITGTFDSTDAAGGFSVTVNAVTYTLGTHPELTNAGNAWTLDLSAITPLLAGTYQVIATATDGAGNASSDTTTNELIIDTSAPTTPTVVSQTTSDTTPIITGTFDSSNYAGGFTVTVNATTYTLGTDPELTNIGNNWTLDLSGITPLAEGTYDVVATATDGAGNSSTDTTSGELVIDTPPTLVSATALCATPTQLQVVFSEAVEPTSAETASNYAINFGISVSSAVLQGDNQTVILTTSTMLEGVSYTLTVNNVTDTSTPANTIATDSQINFTLTCLTCFNDSFPGPALGPDWAVSNNSGAFGDPRIVMPGRLRLTDASGNVATAATLQRKFPAANNRVVVEFDVYAYAGNGADGIALTFSDASVAPAPGAYGGSLGYANRTGVDGFAGGWLGIGIDEYGNFSNPTEGRNGGSGFHPDAITLRGSGVAQTGYNYLTDTNTLTPGVDDTSVTDQNNPAPGHRYRITVDHTMGGREAWVTVERDINDGNGYIEIIPAFDIYAVNPTQVDVPVEWVISYTGSTGGLNNIHEISQLQICTIQQIVSTRPIDHYEISHSGIGATCEAETITITAHDSDHNAAAPDTFTTIDLTATHPTATLVDEWSLKSGNGSFTAPNQYTFDGSETTVSFYLKETSVVSGVDVDIVDNAASPATDLDGDASEDPPLEFRDALFKFYADAVADSIGSQIAGKGSNVAPGSQTHTIRAIKTNTSTGACQAALSSTTTNIDLAYECIDSTTCSGSNLLSITAAETKSIARNNSDGGSGPVTSYTPVSMSFDANGYAPFTFSYGDAGEIQLHAQKALTASTPTNAVTLDGSSNAFIVRPFGFDLDFANDRATNGTAGNTYAADASGSKFIAAGTNFDMQVTAVAWQAGDDTDNDGIPDSGANLTDNTTTPNFGRESIETPGLAIGATLRAPGGGAAGLFSYTTITVGDTATDFSNGVATTTLNWSEVGILDIDASLADYLGDTSADLSGAVTNVGRFAPASFTAAMASDGSLTNVNDSGSTPFTYIGESFDYDTNPAFTITAKNAAGATTTNYTGSFNFLSFSEITLLYPTTDDSTLDELGANIGVTRSTVGTTNDPSDNGDGTLTLTLGDAVSDSFTYTRTNGMVAPFTAALSIDLTAINETTDGATYGGTVTANPTGNQQRYGRLTLNKGFGSEDSDVYMPLLAEYYNGGNFVINSDDADTTGITLSITNVTATDNSTLVLADICVWDTGSPGSSGIGCSTVGAAEKQFSEPPTNGNFNLWFQGPGTGKTGTADILADVPAWLEYDWNDSGDEDPTGVVTFGIYQGDVRFHDWREVD